MQYSICEVVGCTELAHWTRITLEETYLEECLCDIHWCQLKMRHPDHSVYYIPLPIYRISSEPSEADIVELPESRSSIILTTSDDHEYVQTPDDIPTPAGIRRPLFT